MAKKSIVEAMKKARLSYTNLGRVFGISKTQTMRYLNDSYSTPKFFILSCELYLEVLRLKEEKETFTSLKKLLAEERTIEHIKMLVCRYFDIPIEVICKKTRKREIVQARQIAMYLSRMYTTNSLSKIGNTLGKKDHATVLHAYNTIKTLKVADKNIRKYIEDLEKILNYGTNKISINSEV